MRMRTVAVGVRGFFFLLAVLVRVFMTMSVTVGLRDRMAAGIVNAESGVTIFFSAGPFPGSQHEFHWRREETGGNWYYSPEYDLEGWLCPALFQYFDQAPERLYVQVKSKAG